jgi:hypothetical protein
LLNDGAAAQHGGKVVQQTQPQKHVWWQKGFEWVNGSEEQSKIEQQSQNLDKPAEVAGGKQVAPCEPSLQLSPICNLHGWLTYCGA